MRILVLVMLFAVTGCISTEHSSDRKSLTGEPSQYVVNGDGLVCKREKPTGSHRSYKICRSVAEMERMRQEADDATRRLRNDAQINRGG